MDLILSHQNSNGLYMAKISKMSMCNAGDAINWSELVILCFHTLNITFNNKKMQKALETYCYPSNNDNFLWIYMAKIDKMSM